MSLLARSPDACSQATVLALRDFSPKSPSGFSLAPLTLSLEAGRSLALVGPTGAGKSLLLHALIDPALRFEGRYTLGGEPVDHPGAPRVRAQIGMCFQQDALLDDRSALDNVADALRGRGLPDAERRAREALELVGLAYAATRDIRALSGGMRRRLGIARAMAVAPRLLLCDEPTRGLDPEGARRIMDLLLSWTEASGAALIVATHDVDVALPPMDQVVWLHAGALQFIGPPAALPTGTAFRPRDLP